MPQNDSSEHNYLKKLSEKISSESFADKQARLIVVKHDAWCAVYKRQICNCDPDIVVKKAGE